MQSYCDVTIDPGRKRPINESILLQEPFVGNLLTLDRINPVNFSQAGVPHNSISIRFTPRHLATFCYYPAVHDFPASLLPIFPTYVVPLFATTSGLRTLFNLTSKALSHDVGRWGPYWLCGARLIDFQPVSTSSTRTFTPVPSFIAIACSPPPGTVYLPEDTGSHSSRPTKRKRLSEGGKGRPAGPRKKHRTQPQGDGGGGGNGNGGDDSDDGDDGNDDNGNGDNRNRPRYLACHFAKHDMARHSLCLGRFQLKSYNDVVQHIRRHHVLKPNRYCPRCWERFETEQLTNDHIQLTVRCQLRPGHNYIYKDELDAAMACVPRLLDQEEKWLSLWDNLFVGEPRPSSAYVVEVPVQLAVVATRMAESVSTSLRDLLPGAPIIVSVDGILELLQQIANPPPRPLRTPFANGVDGPGTDENIAIQLDHTLPTSTQGSPVLPSQTILFVAQDPHNLSISASPAPQVDSSAVIPFRPSLEPAIPTAHPPTEWSDIDDFTVGPGYITQFSLNNTSDLDSPTANIDPELLNRPPFSPSMFINDFWTPTNAEAQGNSSEQNVDDESQSEFL